MTSVTNGTGPKSMKAAYLLIRSSLAVLLLIACTIGSLSYPEFSWFFILPAIAGLGILYYQILRHFIRNFYQPYQPAGKNSIAHLIGKIAVGLWAGILAYFYYQHVPTGPYQLIVLLGVLVLIGWIFAFRALPLQRQARPDLKSSVSLLHINMMIMCTVILAGLLIWNSMENAWFDQISFYFLEAVILLSAPILTLTAILHDKEDTWVESPVFFDRGASPEDLATHLSYKDPNKSREMIALLRDSRNYELLPDLYNKWTHAPVAFFRFGPNRGQDIYEFETELRREITRLLRQNEPFRFHPEFSFCTSCRQLGKGNAYGPYQITLCPGCNSDQNLAGGAKKLIGTPGKGDEKPNESGDFRINIWEEGTKAIIPSSMDEVEIPADFAGNPDWFVAALAEFLSQKHPEFTAPKVFRYAQQSNLSENSKRILKDLGEVELLP